MNPESTLLNLPVPTTDNSRKQPNDDIGVWVDRNEWDALVAQRNDGTNQSNVTNQGLQSNQRPDPAALPPLIDIYFQKIHPLLPLLDEDEFKQSRESGTIPELLVHAMCLVAAKDTEAAPYLRSSDSNAPISPRHFCSMLHTSIIAALKPRSRIEKVTLMRILALTSLHTEGAEGAEEASILLSQALHYGQTLGIHLGSQASAPTGSDLIMKRLFWCLWALDRVNAATNGRPVIMSDIDIAMDPFTPGESGFPAFEAWLRVAHLLNQIIDFYRPTNDTSSTGWEGDYPGLEEIIDEVGGWQLSSSILATIHLFYLSVGILSHRTRGFREIPRGISSSVRQRLCAIEIVRLMDAPHAKTLHPLPILPYAISLALSVSYQHLRQSQLEHQQADARQDFRTCCKILQNLRRTWCSADVMATLAKKVLDQLDRAPSLATFRIPRSYGSRIGQSLDAPEHDLIPPPTACNHDIMSAQTVTETEKAGEPDQSAGDVDRLEAVDQRPSQDGINLFDNMDDVFGTFMDPNYPLNLDDMSFVDDLTPFDWNVGL